MYGLIICITNIKALKLLNLVEIAQIKKRKIKVVKISMNSSQYKYLGIYWVYQFLLAFCLEYLQNCRFFNFDSQNQFVISQKSNC